MKDKKAKFFCENCGAEVEQNAKFCRHCGRFFTSVRCPACGYVGIAAAFSKGCPSCGYADSGQNIKDSSDNQKDKSKHKKLNLSNQFDKSIKNKKSGDSPLPAWVYLFTIGLLGGIVAAIIYLYIGS